jgi:hypothetical protein
MLPTSPNLSETVYQILNLNPEGYRDLVTPGGRNANAYALLSATDPAKLIVGEPKDLHMLRSLHCGLWLWHDHLEDAHAIARQIETETGAFWHAIMHRRHGDFANSKHWYGQCASHPVLQALGNQSNVILNDLPADNRLLKLTVNGWNSAYLVDLVEQYHQKTEAPFYKVLVVMQQLEWRVLMEYCAALA